MERSIEIGLNLESVDSIGVYNLKAGMYLYGNAPKGMADLVGLDLDGRYCAVEVKSAVNGFIVSESQKSWLEDKINKGAFVCVADSYEMVLGIRKQWEAESSLEKRKSILIQTIRRPLYAKRLCLSGRSVFDADKEEKDFLIKLFEMKNNLKIVTNIIPKRSYSGIRKL